MEAIVIKIRVMELAKGGKCDFKYAFDAGMNLSKSQKKGAKIAGAALVDDVIGMMHKIH